MLVGILSDTHGAGSAAAAAVGLLRRGGAAILVHCGDVGSESVLDALAGEEAAFVWGNTDHPRGPLEQHAAILGVRCMGQFGELEFAGKYLAVTHGDDPRLVRRVLAEQRHDYLLVGHTHVKSDTRVGRVRVINPGALYRAAVKTVALLDPEQDRLEFLEVSL